jgi:hypothetical protein
MVIQIKHGPPNSPYFIIAQPKRQYDKPRIGTDDICFIEMDDPKGNSEKTEAKLVDMWSVHFDDFERMNGLALLAYGIAATELKEAMLKKYPELKENPIVEYWLLRRL